MTLNKQNPGVWRAGAEKLERLDGCSIAKYSTPAFDPEVYAVEFVARRYRIAPSLARVVCGLAKIGRALA